MKQSLWGQTILSYHYPTSNLFISLRIVLWSYYIGSIYTGAVFPWTLFSVCFFVKLTIEVLLMIWRLKGKPWWHHMWVSVWVVRPSWSSCIPLLTWYTSQWGQHPGPQLLQSYSSKIMDCLQATYIPKVRAWKDEEGFTQPSWDLLEFMDSTVSSFSFVQTWYFFPTVIHLL